MNSQCSRPVKVFVAVSKNRFVGATTLCVNACVLVCFVNPRGVKNQKMALSNQSLTDRIKVQIHVLSIVHAQYLHVHISCIFQVVTRAYTHMSNLGICHIESSTTVV